MSKADTNDHERTGIDATSHIGVDGDGNEHRWNHRTGRVEVRRPDGVTAYDLDQLDVDGLEMWRDEVAARAGSWTHWAHDKSEAELIADSISP